jgi:ketosteroid isomerase-like protein
MSQENVQAARGFWERFAAGAASGRVDVALSEPVLHPDVRYVEDPRWPGRDVYTGVEAIRARFAEYVEVFGVIDLKLQETFDVGDVVVLVFGTRGQSVQTGVPFEHEWAYLLTFRDGRVVEWRAYFEKAEALEAVGLQE